MALPEFHTFYTSAETEQKLADMYQKHLQQKQKKLGITPKYDAVTLVKQPSREFYVMDGCVYYKSHDTFVKAPKEPDTGVGGTGCAGGIYTFEPGLLNAVAIFQSRHTSFRVVFEPSIHYRGNGGACRATLYSIPPDDDGIPEILTIEDESNYVL